MAKLVNRLDATQIKRATSPGYYADGGGLYLQVGRASAKSWVYRFTLEGRTREMGLGSFTTLTLAEARLAVRGPRQLKEQGIDPVEARRAQKAKNDPPAVPLPTFREETDLFIGAYAAGWRNHKHAQQWRNTLETYAYPIIGDVPVAQIDTAMITRILEPIWTHKTETANRVRGRIEQILNRAATRGLRPSENPARWRGHLENVLPAREAVAPVRHHPALPYSELGDFMALLREETSQSARALELTILCATRTIETIGARWSEFDFEARAWCIPAHRMKKKREHRVPLTLNAESMLLKLGRGEPSDFVFPGQNAQGHLSNGAMLTLLARMGFSHITTHGFRSTFKDWATEQTDFTPELSEMALAHVIPDKTEAAYRRGDLLEKRRGLMEAWAKYCASPALAIPAASLIGAS